MNKEEITRELGDLRDLASVVEKAITHDMIDDPNVGALEFPMRLVLEKIDFILERIA